jgi:hypothetical protein
MAHSASTTTEGRQQHYMVPQPMAWPIMGSASLFMMALGGVFVMNDAAGGWVSVAAGFMLLLYMMVRWFGDVIRESEAGKYGAWEDTSFRWGMSFFIFSEVMFFAGFFGALYWARIMSVPDLATIESNALLWPNFTSHWPSAGPGFQEAFQTMGAWGLPAINTALLLTSGVTITFAHFALIRNDRPKLLIWLGLTIALGLRVLPRVQRPQPEADHRGLRLDLLHADRVPRLPRHRRRHHADGDLVPLPEGPFHPHPPLRVRRGGLVLALRRRRLAWPLYLCILAITARA